MKSTTTIVGLALLVLVEMSVAASVRDSFMHNLWNAFKKSHRKEYLNDEHEQYRYGVFQTNVENIEKHNAEYAMGMHSYTLGVNVFADWTVAEFRRHMFGAKYGNATSKSSGKFIRLPSMVTIPDTVDWRKEGAVTPIKNQGQCGSCWAFSTTGSLEGAHFRQTGKLVSLSEQQLVDCSGKTGNEGCNGGLMDNAFEYIKENGGIDTEESYPYHAHNEKCHFNKKTIGATCSGYIDVESGDEDALKEAVATVGPVSVAIEVTEDNFMFYKEGVFVDNSCSSSRESLNHGVLVVGYGSNSTMDFWTVKNSWGTTWGESGYIRMARNLKNMCGIATAASYPLVK